jgi:cytochrome c oxidase subunit 2
MQSPASRLVRAASLGLLAILFLAACGGSSQSTPAAPAGADAPTTRIVAFKVAFDPTTITVAAGQPFTILLDNQDAGISHNIVVKDANGAELAKSEIIVGPAQTRLAVPALQAGSYAFACTVHPEMTGTITAQ